MKCDKCGFEHNNRNACPKCGARVIFVNEDYARRRKEWEEANRNGKQSNIPPGIMYSTKEEHDMKHGRDRIVNIKEEGSDSGLSFVAIKDKIIKAIATVIVKCRKKTKEPEFAGKETLDTSKLVLSHKVFKNHKKKFIIGGLAIVLIAVAVPVTVYNIKRMDRSDVVFFDGTKIASVKNPASSLLEIADYKEIYEVNDRDFLITREKGIVICRNGSVSEIACDNPVYITANRDLSALIFLSNEKIYIYDGGITDTGIQAADISKDGCMISDDGSFYAITTIVSDNDNSRYSLFTGTGENAGKITSDDRQKVMIDVNDDGTMLYLDMGNAEYGIVNDRALTYYDGSTVRKIADDVMDYRYLDTEDLIYYTDKDGNLFAYYDGITKKTDNNVDSFCDNALDEDNAYYLKENGCYLADKDADYTTPLFRTSLSDITLYYDKADNYAYITDSGSLYFTGNVPSGASAVKICEKDYGEEPVFTGKNMYIVDTDNNLLKLYGDNRIIDTGVTNLTAVVNSDAVCYVKNGIGYINQSNNDKVRKISQKNNFLQWDKIIYSEKNYYFVTKENSLYEVSKKGNYKTIGETVKICIFVD